jgi:hypothetical protein
MMKRLEIIIFGRATLAVLTGCVPESEQVTKAAPAPVVEPAPEPASSITMVDEGMVAPDGLWLTRRKFSQTLIPLLISIPISIYHFDLYPYPVDSV